jgi:hypothetical protein
LVVCEEVGAKKQMRELLSLIWCVLFSWMWALIYAFIASRNDAAPPLGRNVRYLLPIRLCSTCSKNCGRSDFKLLLCSVPVYADLLAKYPHATIRDCGQVNKKALLQPDRLQQGQ